MLLVRGEFDKTDIHDQTIFSECASHRRPKKIILVLESIVPPSRSQPIQNKQNNNSIEINTNNMALRSSIRRKAIATFLLPLADKLGKMELKKSKLVGPKQVFLPNSGVTLNYYEREAVVLRGSGTNDEPPRSHDQPTILLCHGFTSSAREFLSFLKIADIPENVRILIPEQIGHGEDLKRAFREGDSFDQPDPCIMVESTSEFLDKVKAGPNINALGTSFGGALLYYLKLKRPDAIQKTVLVSPALASCLANPFLNGLIDGTNKFTDFQSRDDVVRLFRNTLWTDPNKRNKGNNGKKKKKKKDPFPNLVYDVIYEMNEKHAPPGHNKALQDNLIKTVTLRMIKDGGHDVGDDVNDDEEKDIYLAASDLDKDGGPRLVVWSEEDQICDHEKGKLFFEDSVDSGRTSFETIPGCGHVFHDDGTELYKLVAPRVRDFLLDFLSHKKR